MPARCLRALPLAFILALAPSPAAASALPRWLEGCWSGERDGARFTERWTAADGATLLGVAHTLKGGRLRSFEYVRIVLSGGRLAYVAQPGGQPPTTFTATAQSPDELTFEDPTHDFPRRVVYRRVAPDRLLAWIDGGAQSKQREEYPMGRVDCAAAGAAAVTGTSAPKDPPAAKGAPGTAPGAAQAVPAPLAPLLGRWDVEARNPDGSQLRFEYEVAAALGGAWATGRAAVPALKVEARDFWRLDPAASQVVRVYLDSQGSYGVLRSPGWQGDALQLQGQLTDKGVATPIRETLRRAGPSELRARWEIQQGGRWQLLREEVLRKR